jgi:hypothetical protein
MRGCRAVGADLSIDLDTDEQSCGNVCEETDVCNGGICMPG